MKKKPSQEKNSCKFSFRKFQILFSAFVLRANPKNPQTTYSTNSLRRLAYRPSGCICPWQCSRLFVLFLSFSAADIFPLCKLIYIDCSQTTYPPSCACRLNLWYVGEQPARLQNVSVIKAGLETIYLPCGQTEHVENMFCVTNQWYHIVTTQMYTTDIPDAAPYRYFMISDAA